MDLAFTKGRMVLVYGQRRFDLVNFHVNQLAFFSSPIITVVALIPISFTSKQFLGINGEIEVNQQSLFSGYVVSVLSMGVSHLPAFMRVKLTLYGVLRYFGQSILSISYARAPLEQLLRRFLTAISLPETHVQLKSMVKPTTLIANAQLAYDVLQRWLDKENIYYLSDFSKTKETVLFSSCASDLMSDDIVEMDSEDSTFIRNSSLGGKTSAMLRLVNRVIYPGWHINVNNETWIVRDVAMSGKAEINLGRDDNMPMHYVVSELTLEKKLSKPVRPLKSTTMTYTATLADEKSHKFLCEPYQGCFDFADVSQEPQALYKSRLFSSNEGVADFVLDRQSKVLVVLKNNDADRPTILGTIPPNGWYQALTVKGVYSFCSYELASLSFDDQKETVALHSELGQQRLMLDDNAITFKAPRGSIIWHSGRLVKTSRFTKLEWGVVDASWQIKQTLLLNTADASLVTEGNCLIQGAKSLQLEAGELRVRSKDTVSYQAENIELISDCFSYLGEMAYHASTITIHCQSLSLNVAGSRLELNDSGVTIYAPQSHISGALHVLKV